MQLIYVGFEPNWLDIKEAKLTSIYTGNPTGETKELELPQNNKKGIFKSSAEAASLREIIFSGKTSLRPMIDGEVELNLIEIHECCDRISSATKRTWTALRWELRLNKKYSLPNKEKYAYLDETKG